MRFYKKEDEYIVLNMTGNKNNYLSVVFSDEEKEPDFVDIDNNNKKINIDNGEIKIQIDKAFQKINLDFGKFFFIKTVNYISSDDFSDVIYYQMVYKLIKKIINNEDIESL